MQSMFKSSISYFILTSMVIPIILVSSYVVYQRNFQKLPVKGPIEVVKGKEKFIKTPQWTFTDQNNMPFDSHRLDSNIQVFNFFFTSCPTVCPTMNKNVQKVQQVYLTNDLVQFVSISVDPERDTPERLKAYESAFSLNNDQWHFLTGDKNTIYSMARKGYNLSATDADGGSNNILHSQQVLLIDNQQQIRGIYNGTEYDEMARMIKDIDKLIKEIKKSE